MFVALHDATNAGVHRKFTISLVKIYIYCKIKTNLLLYCIFPFYIILFCVKRTLRPQRILPDSNRYKQPLREKNSFVSPERLFDWR